MTAVPPTPAPRPESPPPPPAAPAKSPSPPNNLVGVAVLAAFVAAGYGLDRGLAVKPLTFAFTMLGWTLSVMAHEFSHALTGYMAGDVTVRAKGYLAFDPRKYGDLGTSLVLPLIFLALGGIGFPGGAVYLRNDLMRGPFWRAAAALAGPMATLMVLLGLAIVLRIWMGAGTDSALFPAAAFLAFLQATALILNLLPIPGLDGFGAIRPFLPLEWTPGIRKFEGLAMVGLFLLIFISPVGGRLLFGGGMTLSANLGVPIDAIRIGYGNFHFWR
ncbi:site-2 protease family protein [Phenylobacterium sp.]|uniref:site-2 protease family protein n=1 Tax=Phenylobacterium sp. TaxID=1871053 RepID=UPI002DF66B79|nr:site-2 protease family protein [Phenylobacterium sp.]